MNNRAGGFAAPVNFACGDGPTDVATGDLDRNGMPDLVVTNSSARTVSVFLNARDGSTVDMLPTETAMRGFQVVPNPSSGEVWLLPPRQGMAARFTVLDVSGRTVASGRAGAGRTLLAAKGTLAPGLYFVKVESEKQTAWIKAVVSQ